MAVTFEIEFPSESTYKYQSTTAMPKAIETNAPSRRVVMPCYWALSLTTNPFWYRGGGNSHTGSYDLRFHAMCDVLHIFRTMIVFLSSQDLIG
jgi:hypothetical protein